MNTTNVDHAVHNERDAWAPLLALAAREVFDVMLGSQLENASQPTGGESFDVTAMVGLAGHLCGVLTLRCDSKSAALMTSKMLGIDLAHAGPETWDAIGEICNMVAGNFKNKISGLAETCQLSVPTVITGGEYSLYTLADDPAIEIILLFEGRPLTISLKVHS